MTFLTPLFFLGALALAVPVLIHLTHREKSEVVDFPSLMFLRRIPYRSVRRQRLRHLLLFALRCLALLLLVLAFARPFIQSESVSASGNPLGPRELVVLIDNSYSMGYLDRLEEAKADARSRVQTLAPEDRVSLIVFSNRAAILNEPTSDSMALGALVDSIELSAGTTRFEPALKLAKRIMDETDRPRREVVLISDFQRIGWEGDEDAWLPAGAVLTPVDLSVAEPENLSVTDVVLERDQLSGRERITVSARVTNKAPVGADPTSSRVLIELNGRELQTKPFELAPNSSETISFEPLTLPAGIVRGTVRVDADQLPADDSFHFVVWPGQALSVLLVEARGRRGDRGSLYIQRALDIGDRPSFRVESRTSTSRDVRASDLRGRDVVVLNDVASISDASARLIARFVEEGGGLLAILGEASGPNTYSGEAQRLVPAPLGEPTDRARDFGGTLSYLDYSSPVFEIFSAPHSGDFTSAKFFRYRSFRSAVTGGVLARYDDGAPALLEHRLGEGRVLVWTSSLDTFWNDLARQPVFLPFVHRLVEHAASYAEANPWYSVGEVADLTRYRDLSGGDAGAPGELVISSPSSKTSTLSPDEARPLITLDEQGFYEIRPAGVSSADAASLASNLDLTESDLASMDPEELVASVTFHETASDSEQAAALTPAEQESRQAFWFYLLIALFVVMALETILGNRLSRAKTL